MSIHGGTENTAKQRFYFSNPPPDPVLQAAAKRRPHHNAATGRTLFAQSVMPIGEHVGKTMDRVPKAYLEWIHSQTWMATHPLWKPVWDYVQINVPPPEPPTKPA